MSAWAGAGASAPKDASAGAARPKASAAPRKRSRGVHQAQMLNDWFGDTEKPTTEGAPTVLLDSMQTKDLYEDPYSAEPGKDVSFDALPVEIKQAMLDGISKNADMIQSQAIRADEDPSAIVVQRNHVHDIVELGDALLGVVRRDNDDDALHGIKRAHRAQLTVMHSFVEAEMVFAQYNMQTNKHMAVDDINSDMPNCFPHSVQVPPCETFFVAIFEVDDRGIFYCAVALTARCAVTKGYQRWSTDTKKALGKLTGEYAGHVYYTCDCA